MIADGAIRAGCLVIMMVAASCGGTSPSAGDGDAAVARDSQRSEGSRRPAIEEICALHPRVLATDAPFGHEFLPGSYSFVEGDGTYTVTAEPWVYEPTGKVTKVTLGVKKYKISNPDFWYMSVEFDALYDTRAQIEVGTYDALKISQSQTSQATLLFGVNGIGCNGKGSFTVDRIDFVDPKVIDHFAGSFAWRCEGDVLVRGCFRYER